MSTLSFIHTHALSNHRTLVKFYLKAILGWMASTVSTISVLQEPSSSTAHQSQCETETATTSPLAKCHTFPVSVNSSVLSTSPSSYNTWHCRLGQGSHAVCTSFYNRLSCTL